MLSNASQVLLKHAPDAFERMWAERLIWRLKMHHFQAPPTGDWRGWMLQAGRGSGKTLTGSFDVLEHCLDNPGYRYGIIAATFNDAKTVCVEGETGLIAVALAMGLIEGVDFEWNRSDGEFKFTNGSLAKLYSAEKPNRLRGPQFHRVWLEELAAWKDAHLGDALNTTFNNAIGFALRLGDDARYIVTTTPRRNEIIKDLAERDNVAITRGSTYDNIENLAPNVAEEILRYEGSHIGRQEIHGEIVEEVEGAYWTLEMIEQALEYTPEEWGRTICGVDPSGGADEIGIVVAAEIPSCSCPFARDRMPHFAVLDDRSLKASPEIWAARAVSAEADRIVAERNYGGDMVEAVIRQVDVNAPVKLVNASRGKLVRAEPIAALYEQKRVHHLKAFPQMEDEMTTYVGGENWSPNRMDALVWALTELIANPKRKWAAY